MKYCVSGRQPYSVLKQADEIKVAYRDRDRIMDFIEQIPDKSIILELESHIAPIEEQVWKMYQEKFAHFCVATNSLHHAKELNKLGINWYWPFPITTYYELRWVLALKPCYIKLGAPLCFELNKIQKTTKVPIRLTPNLAVPEYLTHMDDNPHFSGTWIRPEDVKYYEPYVSVMEFYNSDGRLKTEEVLLETYQKELWPGNLNLLFSELNYNVDNRGIPEDLGERRLNCGQRCMETGNCHLCESALKFADQLRKTRIARSKETELDNN